MSSLVSIESFGESENIDVVINVRHDGHFDQTIHRYGKYLKELCPHYDKLEILHKIEEDSGTYDLAIAIAKLLCKKNYRILVNSYKNSRIVVEQNRLLVDGDKDRRIRNIVDPKYSEKLYKAFIEYAINDHEMGDDITLDLLQKIKPRGIYIDLHSMADRCPIPKNEYTIDKCVPIDLNLENFDRYISCWQSPKGDERFNCFLSGLPDGERADSQPLTQGIQSELQSLGAISTLDAPYSLRPAHASYRDALIAKKRDLHISIPDLKKSILCNEVQPGIFVSNKSKIELVAEGFFKAIDKTLLNK